MFNRTACLDVRRLAAHGGTMSSASATRIAGALGLAVLACAGCYVGLGMLPQKKKRRKRKRKKKRTKIGAKLTTGLALFAATPALAVFCRAHSGRCDASAYLYARRATGLPLKVAREQRAAAAGRRTHPREKASWSAYRASEAAELVRFITAVTAVTADGSFRHGRHGELEQPASGKWARVTPENAAEVCGPAAKKPSAFDGGFFAVFARLGDGAAASSGAAPSCSRDLVLAFRGGDGGTEDAKTHPGSPAWAFVQGEKAERVPAEVRKLAKAVLSLADGAAASAEPLRVRVVGYSLGALPALAAHLLLARGGVASTCTLLNAATAFWPHWLHVPGGEALLPQDWWDTPCAGVESWVIRHDPLSESVAATRVRAPQVPGRTFVLPECSASALENHALKWFKQGD